MIKYEKSLFFFTLFISTGILFSACSNVKEVTSEQEEIHNEYGSITQPESDDSLDRIYFEHDSSRLDSEAERVLHSLLEELLALPPNSMIIINAYSNEKGSEQLNVRLSFNRARTVARFLTDKGINAEMIETNVLGKAPDSCDEQNAGYIHCRENRRVEFEIIKP